MFLLRNARKVVWLLSASCIIAVSATAQTNESFNFGANLGTLTYTLETSTGTCEGTQYNIDHYYNFVYTSPPLLSTGQPISQPLGQDAYFYYLNGRFSDYCTTGGEGFVYNGSGYAITVNPIPAGPGPTITVPGYVNPKYVIVGLIYAPPGGIVQGGVAKGNVSYSDSNLVSSTVTSKSSFGTSYTEGNTLSISAGILGWLGGKVSGSASSSYTTSTTTTDSTAVTVQKTSGTTLAINGPTCPYCGVDHDYDLIGVWVNPLQLYTLTNGGVVRANGYGYSTFDEPGMDVYWVNAGELNGDLPVRSSTTTEFARAWAAVEGWPSGAGPGLTAQDEQYILKTDPYWDCTYQSPWTNGETSPCAKPPDDTRFTESAGNESFPYTQPEVGDSPSSQGYTFSYTNTDTAGTDITYATSQKFGLEATFSASVFGVAFSDTLSESQTITHTYETSSQFTSSNTTTATATIWQPPCNVVGDACSPVYPPANAYNPISCAAIASLGQAFGQGYTMYIYQDNLFGTFLMEPYGQ